MLGMNATTSDCTSGELPGHLSNLLPFDWGDWGKSRNAATQETKEELGCVLTQLGNPPGLSGTHLNQDLEKIRGLLLVNLWASLAQFSSALAIQFALVKLHSPANTSRLMAHNLAPFAYLMRLGVQPLYTSKGGGCVV